MTCIFIFEVRSAGGIDDADEVEMHGVPTMRSGGPSTESGYRAFPS